MRFSTGIEAAADLIPTSTRRSPTRLDLNGRGESTGAGFAFRTQMCESFTVNGHEFEKRLRRLARRKGLSVRFEPHGKGSHGRLYFGERFTTLKDRRKELGQGLLHAMCRQLGIDFDEL